MGGTLLSLREPTSWLAMTWEFYLPKRAAYVTELYRFLGAAVRMEPGVAAEEGAPHLRLEGYSIYEVDGAYRGAGGSVYEERVLVVRLILPKTATPHRLRLLGMQLLELTGFEEEEVWIVEQSGARVHSFRASHHEE